MSTFVVSYDLGFCKLNMLTAVNRNHHPETYFFYFQGSVWPFKNNTSQLVLMLWLIGVFCGDI